MDSFLKAIPLAARSEYALAAYAIAAILFLFGVVHLARLRSLGVHISHLPKEDRFDALKEIIGSPLPRAISAEQWLRHRKMQLAFLLLAGLLIAVFAIAVMAIKQMASPSGLPSQSSLRDAVPDRESENDLGIEPSSELATGTHKPSSTNKRQRQADANVINVHTPSKNYQPSDSDFRHEPQMFAGVPRKDELEHTNQDAHPEDVPLPEASVNSHKEVERVFVDRPAGEELKNVATEHVEGGKGEVALVPALALTNGGTPNDPTLQRAELWTHTNDDNKDHDTGIYVCITTHDSNVELARMNNADYSADDRTEYSDYSEHIVDVPVVSAGTKMSQASGFKVNIRQATNGNDTWKFHAKVTLYFSDGRFISKTKDHIVLRNDNAEVDF